MAIPYVGWAIAIASVLSSVFDQHGGPKTESGYGSEDVGRGDAAGATQIAQSIQQQYSLIAGQLGLANTQLANLGVFYASDPQGTAQTQLQVRGGSYVRSDLYGGQIENAGRSDADLKAAISQAAAQLILSNLKSSGLTGKISDYINAIDVKASADDINKSLAAATSAKAVYDEFGKLGPAFQTFMDMSVEGANKWIAAAGGIQAATQNLASYVDNFYTDTEKKKFTEQSITSQLQAAGVASSLNFDALDARNQFRALVEQYSQAGNTDAVNALLSVSSAFAAITPAAQDTAQAMGSLTDQVKQWESTYVAAIGAATKAEQDRASAMQQWKAQQIISLYAGAASMVDSAQKKVDDAKSTLEQAQKQAAQEQAQIYQQAVAERDRILGDADRLRSYRLGLFTNSQTSPLAPKQLVEALRFQLRTVTPDNVQQRVADYLTAFKGQTANRLTYAHEVARSDQVVSVQEQSLRAQASQVMLLANINSHTQEIADLLRAEHEAEFSLGVSKLNQMSIGKSNADQDTMYWQFFKSAVEAYGGNFDQVRPGIDNGTYSMGGAGILEYLRTLPGFAGGGIHQGGLAIVGEQGPEIIDTPGPARIYSNSDSRQILSGALSSSADVCNAIAAMGIKLDDLLVGLASVAFHSQRSAELLDEFQGAGMPIRNADKQDLVVTSP